MAVLRWDRLLETCCRKEATDILLRPGSPPLLRSAKGWQALALPPLLPEDVIELAEEAMRLGAPKPTEHGHTYCDFLHDDKAGFRAMAFGYPETTLLIV